MSLKNPALDKDKVMCFPIFGKAIVFVRPGKFKASGEMKIKGKKVCISGDEANIEIADCGYISPPFIVPGKGSFEFKLGSDQEAKKVKNKEMLIIRGTFMDVTFKPSSPAKMPPNAGGASDPAPEYKGKALIQASKSKVKTH